MENNIVEQFGRRQKTEPAWAKEAENKISKKRVRFTLVDTDTDKATLKNQIEASMSTTTDTKFNFTWNNGPDENRTLELIPKKEMTEGTLETNDSDTVELDASINKSPQHRSAPEHSGYVERAGTVQDGDSSPSSARSDSKEGLDIEEYVGPLTMDECVSNSTEGEGSNNATETSGGDYEKDSEVVIMAGPTTPLVPRRIQTLKPMNFNQEPLHLRCEWDNCSYETTLLDLFMEHVVAHIPTVEISNTENSIQVLLVCNWKTCPFKIPQSEDLQRHIYLHAYHTKLKCIGANTAIRCNLNVCRADAGNGNILPDLSDNLICAWGDCSEKFINIQQYYNHIRYHCDDNPKGRNVPGGISCLWTGCSGTFTNIARLRDHVRSHTQEKLLSCPICGALFSNRTRFFDHCRRQTLLDNQNYACNVCMKMFSTARLLRDHIRSHVNSYRCLHCDMTCSSPSALNSHMKYRHSDDKPFQCAVCPYAAKAQCDLIRHVKLHAKGDYKCRVKGCSYRAKSMVSITNHFEKAHGETREPKYVCHVCDKRFLRGYYLTKHLTSAHGLQWPSGHSRFRYKLGDDSLYRLFTLRYESEDAEVLPGQERTTVSSTPNGETLWSQGEAATQETSTIVEVTNTRKESSTAALAEQILGYKDPEVTYVLYPTNDVNIKL